MWTQHSASERSCMSTVFTVPMALVIRDLPPLKSENYRTLFLFFFPVRFFNEWILVIG